MLTYTSSIYDYYWFKKNVYFTYIVEFPTSVSVYLKYPVNILYDPPAGSINSFLINWSIVEIDNEWFYVNYTVIIQLDSEKIVLSRLIRVNSKTLEVYVKPIPIYAEHHKSLGYLHFPGIEIDGEEYLWLAEFPFILRPGSKVKFVGNTMGYLIAIYTHPIHEFSVKVSGIGENVNEVYERIKEFLSNLSSILSKYEYWRGKNYTELALFKIALLQSEHPDTIFYRACRIDDLHLSSLSIGVIVLKEPPSEKSYIHGKINLSPDRLARIATSEFLLPGGVFRVFANPKEIVNEIEKWGSKHIDTVLVDPINEVVLVLDNGKVVCAQPLPYDTSIGDIFNIHGLYDVFTGLLIEISGEYYNLLYILHLDDLFTEKNVSIVYREYPHKRVVRIRLIDSNINFDRPIIGIKSPDSLQTNISERKQSRESTSIFIFLGNINILLPISIVI